LIERAMDEELQQIAVEVGQERFAAGRYELAAKLFGDMVLADELDEFLTLPAYELID
jgi:malate synthase